MRWIFADRKQGPEARRVAAVQEQVDEWWKAFAAKTNDLEALFAGKKKWDLPEWMGETLHAIDERLMWEYGPGTKGKGHRLVITPESQKQLRPLANSIVASAPEIPGWEFHPYRLAEGMENAKATIEGRTGGTIDGIEVVVEPGPANLVTLQFQSAAFQGPEDPDALNRAFVAAETFLGENVLDHWIGEISVARKKKGFLGLGKSKAGAVPLAEMNDAVKAVIKGIKAGLPEKPYHAFFETAQWSGAQLQPTQGQEDYPGRSDLFVYTTLNTDLLQASLLPGFSSSRFSRNKETFCYVKLDGSDRPKGSEVEFRTEFEDALNAALTGVGGTVGAGTGIRYSYIDLALTEFTKNARLVRDVLRKAEAPHRSWVLFLDADYCGEWLGVYDDTPPPPTEEGA